jgi:hypothetical protein
MAEPFAILARKDEKELSRLMQPYRIGDQKNPMGLPRRARPGADVGKPTAAENEEALGMLAMMAAGGPAISAATRLPAAAYPFLAGLYGMTATSPTAESDSSADIRELVKDLTDRGSPELTRLYDAIASARGRQKTLDSEASKARPGSQARSASAGRSALAADIADMNRAIAAERERVGAEASDRANSVMAARSAGEDARNRERDKAPPTFSQYYSGLQKELPMLPPAWALPLVAGAGAVAASKAMSVPSAAFGRVKASQALGRGDYAAAERLANTHAPAGAGHFLKDVGLGAAAGTTFGSMPLAADLIMQPQANPEKAAQQAYAAELLPIDPRAEAAQSRVDGMPDANPALDKAKDPWAWARGLGAGAIEGAAGGKLAGIAVDALKPKFMNVRSEAATQRAAADAARNSGTGPGHTPPPGNAPTHPLANTQGRYPGPGTDGREFVRGEYRDQYLRDLSSPNPSGFSREVQAAASSAGGRLPNMTTRARETNAAVQEFVSRTGRPPVTDADWSQIFRNTGTLAVPGIAAGAGLMDFPYSGSP